ncbi:hypothetical protein Tco_0597314 [Tanacetum coccineum]
MNPRRKVSYGRVLDPRGVRQGIKGDNVDHIMSDEYDVDEYYRLPPLLPCFQTPKPCTKLDSISHYNKREVDIDNMTLKEYERYELTMSRRKSEVDIDSMTIEEYELYMAMQCSKTIGLLNPTHGFTS